MTATIAIKKITSLVSESAEKVKTLWGPLEKVLTFSPADDVIAPAKTVSVSVEKGLVSVAYGTRILSSVGIKDSKRYPSEEGYPTPESLASSAELAINDFGASRKNITLCIPKAWAVVRTAEFPSTVKESISDVISYELDRLTPFSAEEAFYDFRILGESGGRLKLLVAAVKAELINPYINALREKGCNVKRLTVNLTAIGALCSYALKLTYFLYVKIDEEDYEGGIFSNGVLTASFTGGLEAGDEASKVEAIMRETGTFVDAAKPERPAQIVISMKEKYPVLREMLKRKIGAPLKILDETDLPFVGSMKDIPYEALGGLLESLWPKARGLNLLEKGYREKVKKPFVLTIILAAALVVLSVLYMMAPVRIEENRLREIQRQVAAKKADVKKVESLKKDIEGLEKEISSIDNFKKARPMMALDIVRELTNIFPKTAWLTRAKVTETTVEIEGYASSATGLIPKLEASKYFKKAEFASPIFRDVRMNADRFNIKMEIEGVVKQEKGEKGEKPKKK